MADSYTEIVEPVFLDSTARDILTAIRAQNAGTDFAFDGTKATYDRLMRKWFRDRGAHNATPEELTRLVAEWYTITRTGWNGWTTFYKSDTSAVSTGTRGGDNENLTCVPSTESVKGQDDYEGLPLFACIDCNFTLNPETLEPVITAIDGISPDFTRYNPARLVGVLQMAGYVWFKEDDTTFTIGYTDTSAQPYKHIEPLPDAVTVTNQFRPWVVHAKYPSKTVDGKMTSYSGVIPSGWMSHNALQTLARNNDNDMPGGSICDQTFLEIMTYIKYASLTLDGILNGCLDYDVQVYAAVGEEGVRRVILSETDGAKLKIGSGVLIGAASSGKDRSTEENSTITGREGAIIKDIVDVTIDEVSYKAVYVDTAEAFDTVAESTLVSTFYWPNGTCDGVLGNDGSPESATDQTHPIKLQGIEFLTGGSEVVADVILNLYQADDGTYVYEPNIVRRKALQSTSITSGYVATGLICEQDPSKTQYGFIAEKEYAEGMFFPIKCGASSSTRYRDAFYRLAKTTGLRELILRGSLLNGVARGGLGSVNGITAVSYSPWFLLARPSSGGNRGVWGA